MISPFNVASWPFEPNEELLAQQPAVMLMRKSRLAYVFKGDRATKTILMNKRGKLYKMPYNKLSKSKRLYVCVHAKGPSQVNTLGCCLKNSRFVSHSHNSTFYLQALMTGVIKASSKEVRVHHQFYTMQ